MCQSSFSLCEHYAKMMVIFIISILSRIQEHLFMDSVTMGSYPVVHHLVISIIMWVKWWVGLWKKPHIHNFGSKMLIKSAILWDSNILINESHSQSHIREGIFCECEELQDYLQFSSFSFLFTRIESIICFCNKSKIFYNKDNKMGIINIF